MKRQIVWLQIYLCLLHYRSESKKVVNEHIKIIRAGGLRVGGGHCKLNPHWLKQIRQWNFLKWAVRMHGLIYEMKILNINQFAWVEEPTSFTLNPKVISDPFSEGGGRGHVRICNKAWGYYIKGQKQFDIPTTRLLTLLTYVDFSVRKTWLLYDPSLRRHLCGWRWLWDMLTYCWYTHWQNTVPTSKHAAAVHSYDESKQGRLKTVDGTHHSFLNNRLQSVYWVLKTAVKYNISNKSLRYNQHVTDTV